MTVETGAYLLAALLGLAAILFDHLRNREPDKAVTARLDALESWRKTIDDWRRLP